MRCARSIAWRSTKGFQSGSRKTTLSAPVVVVVVVAKREEDVVRDV